MKRRFKNVISGNNQIVRRVIIAVLAIAVLTCAVEAREFTLETAVDIALNQTARGEMIRGNLEVARQNYSARRINMYLPEISLNGSLPSYQLNESYQPYSNSFDKQLYEERSLNFRSFVQLKQSLITGGNLTAQVNLLKEDNRYPDVRFSASDDVRITEDSRRGFLNLELEQPLFRPSSVKKRVAQPAG